jgi:hypothetical protein
MVLTAIAAIASLPAGAHAAPSPTAATVLRGDLEEGRFTTLVAVGRLPSGKLSATAFRVDSVRGSTEVYDVVIGRGRCSSGGAVDAQLAKLPVANEKLVTRRMSGGIGEGASDVVAVVVDRETEDSEACARLGAITRFGAITSPRDSASGLPTGIVVLRRAGRQVRVTTLFGDLGDTGTHEFGASRHECADAFTATDDLWQFHRTISRPFMDYTVDGWRFRTTNSLAIVDSDAAKAKPAACKEWNDDWLAPK